MLKIQRKDDEHTISDKIYDFSSETVSNLIKEGEKDALQAILEHEEIVKVSKNKLYKQIPKKNQLRKFIEDVKKINTEDDQYVMQCAKSKLEIISKE